MLHCGGGGFGGPLVNRLLYYMSAMSINPQLSLSLIHARKIRSRQLKALKLSGEAVGRAWTLVRAWGCWADLVGAAELAGYV